MKKEKGKENEIRVEDDHKVKTGSQSRVFSISKRVVVPKVKSVFTVIQRSMVPERTVKVPEMGKEETVPEGKKSTEA